jgi:hypothetical protein
VWNCVGLEELERQLVSAGCDWERRTNIESVFLWFIRLEYVDACEDDFKLKPIAVEVDVM